MKQYGITKKEGIMISGDRYVYNKIKYENLQDAVEIAKQSVKIEARTE